MKFKKLFICILAFSLLLTSCTSKSKNNSNSKNTKETKKESIENASFDEEIKKVEIPKNATEFKFLNYNAENNKLYFRYTSNGNIVYASKNIKDDITDIIYEIKGNEKTNMYAIARDGVIDETLFIVKVNDKNVAKGENKFSNVYEYNYIVIDKNKNVQKYFNEDKAEISGDYQVYNKMPTVTIDGRNLTLTCENTIDNNIIKSYILQFNIDGASLRLLEEKELKTENKKLNGSYIKFAGGLGNEIYYQVLNYQNDDKMEEGSSDIYKRTSPSEFKKVLELDKIKSPQNAKNGKTLFVSGDDKLLFTSGYVLDDSKYNTGKVFNLSNMQSTDIPDVTNGMDIVDAYKINDLYLLDNTYTAYVYNSDGKLLLKKTYRDKEKSISKIEVTNNCISYLVKENEDSKEAELHILKLKTK
ncbi:hypothetical protein WFJ11_07155 [Parvimonas micra]|uniref:hypothetical protein n=1 Tax=Parvimonas micra TaxID=33033 RepID=UPI001CAE6A3D|nr:hypothetical protein [Parvimonas sp.]